MEQIEYIIGDENKLRQMPEIRAWKPFDKRVINFCSELSETLMK